MNYNCHKLGGVTAAFCVGYSAYSTGLLETIPINIPQIPYNISTYIPLVIMTACAYWSSTLPDIDHQNSCHGKKHQHISSWLSHHGGHRGMTHYPITLVGFISVFYWLLTFIKQNNAISENVLNVFWWGLIGIIAGWSSHIILDLFNSAGVSLLAPFSRIRFKIPTGIRIKKQLKTSNKKRKQVIRVRWRYLRGGNVLDDFLLVVMCVLVMAGCIKYYG